MLVLVNRNSASASEIVTGSLQDHDRALVVGETTFGKALVQSVYTISEEAGLALTTGRYFTPSGRMIQRPWDGAFDEYLTYTLRDQKADSDHSATQLKYTDAGRKVYGGGGIEPDKFYAGTVQGFNPTRFGRLLNARSAFANYAEHYAAEGDTRMAGAMEAKKHLARGFAVTDAMVADFKSPSRPRRSRSTRTPSRRTPIHQGHDPLRNRRRAVWHRRGAEEPDHEGSAGAVRAGAVCRCGEADGADQGQDHQQGGTLSLGHSALYFVG